jgi:predicted RNA-binding Zn ribbon-like protein
VDFDSHVSGTVAAAVALVNAVTPGLRGGRPAAVPTGPALVEAVTAAVQSASRQPVPPVAPADAERLVGWAGRLRDVIEQVEAGRVDEACTLLNGVLADVQAVPVLARHDGEPWHLHFHRPDAPAAQSWAASLATGLAVVLGNPAVDRLGVCRAEACDRVYVDVSRNGTRRFCSTACQNRVKAATYRRRRAQAGAEVS